MPANPASKLSNPTNVMLKANKPTQTNLNNSIKNSETTVIR